MKMIKSVIKSALFRRGYVHSWPAGQFQLHFQKLAQAKERGLVVGTAVDGGAARGDWTSELKRLYPEAQVLMIEPRDEPQPLLEQLARRTPGLTIAKVLVGDRKGVASFNVHGSQSSILPNSKGHGFGEILNVEMTTLDELILARQLPYPDLIKLDLQGAELPCLNGAQSALSHAQAVVLEVSFIPLQQGVPLVAEVIQYMAERRFRCYDILGLLHRPLDGALAQGDLLFIREGHELLKDPRWDQDSAWA